MRQHAAHIFLYGQDPGVVSLAHNARTLCLMGYLDQARQQADEAIRLARQIVHPFSLALAHYHAAVVHHTCRDLQRSQEMTEVAIALCTKHAFPYWLSSAQVLKGWVLTQQGQPDVGIALMLEGLAAYQATGAELNRPYSLTLLGEAHRALGKAAEGLTLLSEALQDSARNAGYFYQAEMYRLQGELLLNAERGLQNNERKTNREEQRPVPIHHSSFSVHRYEEAEACFLKAIDIARKQQAKSCELRATMSLSHLWRRQGKTQEARAQLTPLYAWFTEGLDSLDLQEAKTLLDELG